LLRIHERAAPWLPSEAIPRIDSFKTNPLPKGQMLDFGASNVVKVRAGNGATTDRFYAGKRHVDNLWIENASKTCAP